MDFCPPPRTKTCMICKKQIDIGAPTAEVQKQAAHKECFKCAICDCELLQGQCSQDIGLAKTDFLRDRGPLWFCRNHMMLGSGQKIELLRKKTK